MGTSPMKVKLLKGIVNNLASSLYSRWSREMPEIKPKVFEEKHTNILEEKDDFDKHCLDFIKKRLPNFDRSRFKRIDVHVTVGWVKVIAKVDDKEYSKYLE